MRLNQKVLTRWLTTILLVVSGVACSHQPTVNANQIAAIHGIVYPSLPSTSTTIGTSITVKMRASRSRPVVVVRPELSGSDIYDRLAMCESGMSRYTPGPFHSYFQWMVSTWRNVSGLPGMPEDYDYATQKEVVMRKMPISSWHSQFPVCSRRIGV